MTGDLVFITGGTGLIGFAVLVEALKNGYRVRASIRRPEQEIELRSHRLIKPFDDKLEFVVVSDITTEGAFDVVLKDVTFIEHIASALPNPTINDPETQIIQPAIRGTTSILNSALKTKSVRRIVVTSSAMAVVPGPALAEGDLVNVYSGRSRVTPLPKAPWGNPLAAYQSAKILALAVIDTFIAEKKPKFTVVNIMPGFVFGRNELVTEAGKVSSGTNQIPMAIAMGMKLPGARPGNTTDLRDVARIHIESLNLEKIPGNKNFMLDAGRMEFDDLNNIATRHFPDAVSDGTFPLGGSMATVQVRVDVSEELAIFGPMKTYEDAVVSVLSQYLALKNKH